MTHHEGILVSKDTVINAAAIGADIEDSMIEFLVYIPSDTARNLDTGARFTYSLTHDPYLFFEAALTGHDEPRTNEIGDREVIADEEFFYPEGAAKVYFCEVDEVVKKTIRDKYGSSEVKEVKGKILRTVEDKKNFIGRDDPLVDAMVHASRISVADEPQKRQLYKKIKSILEDDESRLKKKIIGFVEERLDEV